MKEFKEMVNILTELKNDPYELTRIRLEMACERANNNRIIKTKNVFDFLFTIKDSILYASCEEAQ